MTTPGPTASTGPTAADAPEGTGAPLPQDIDALRLEIDRLDREILAAVQRRSEVSRTIGAARRASGGVKVVHVREMAVLERFGVLGPEGRQLAMLLLSLGRGRLGH
ncbi:chorismate mutase [Rhodococcus antarcticus]|jgi:chorismate mutase|uniref:Chorismate mutase n=1 Tax=Rhodococcus antarcticus TaxID=2987751 RepID=A0ABY6P2E6_9NOCA|nr:chorismate mutase [Rhodococcus antarcticus]UZJ25393.1 chorismate mutase [Rhodococcus antarcticus]